MKTKILYSASTKTFRLMPQNYWLASIKENNLVFDSWDGMTKKMFRKNPFLKFRVFIAYLLKLI